MKVAPSNLNESIIEAIFLTLKYFKTLVVQIKARHELKIFFTIIICMVWLLNGLICKLLNLVPRHQEIVERILHSYDPVFITKIIGVLELCMVIWILSRIKPKLCAITQILIVAVMNVIEFLLVPDLLLFGRMNMVFAGIFCVIIYLNEFVLYSGGEANN